MSLMPEIKKDISFLNSWTSLGDRESASAIARKTLEDWGDNFPSHIFICNTGPRDGQAIAHEISALLEQKGWSSKTDIDELLQETQEITEAREKIAEALATKKYGIIEDAMNDIYEESIKKDSENANTTVEGEYEVETSSTTNDPTLCQALERMDLTEKRSKRDGQCDDGEEDEEDDMPARRHRELDDSADKDGDGGTEMKQVRFKHTFIYVTNAPGVGSTYIAWKTRKLSFMTLDVSSACVIAPASCSNMAATTPLWALLNKAHTVRVVTYGDIHRCINIASALCSNVKEEGSNELSERAFLMSKTIIPVKLDTLYTIARDSWNVEPFDNTCIVSFSSTQKDVPEEHIDEFRAAYKELMQTDPVYVANQCMSPYMAPMMCVRFSVFFMQSAWQVLPYCPEPMFEAEYEGFRLLFERDMRIHEVVCAVWCASVFEYQSIETSDFVKKNADNALGRINRVECLKLLRDLLKSNIFKNMYFDEAVRKAHRLFEIGVEEIAKHKKWALKVLRQIEGGEVVRPLCKVCCACIPEKCEFRYKFCCSYRCSNRYDILCRRLYGK
jgi:hypothetical protein